MSDYSTLWESLLANALLAAAYAGYKVIDRCLHSKCRFNKQDGFTFDLDGDPEAHDTAVDMERLGAILMRRGKSMRELAVAPKV